MIKKLYIILFIVPIIIFAQDDANETPAWKAWKKLEKVILENKEKESIALLSGRMKEGFFRFGMTNINTEVRGMNAKFVREFANQKDNTRFVIMDVNGEQRTLMFIKSGKEWLFDEQISESYTSSEDAAIGLGQFIANQQLKEVYESIIAHCKANEIKRIPSPKEMKLSQEMLSFRDPETGLNEKILLARNVDFTGSSEYLLAVTENVIGARRQGIFEDASIAPVSKNNFVRHKIVLGLEKSDVLVLDKKEIDSLVNQLGSGKSKERKAAREQLLKLDENAIKVLIKYKDAEDLEVKLSIKEIIEAISKKTSIKRPKI